MDGSELYVSVQPHVLNISVFVKRPTNQKVLIVPEIGIVPKADGMSWLFSLPC